jgi:carboxymethylenebutenolidase
METDITKLYDEYKDGRIDRRTFLKKLTLLTGSAAAALAILPALGETNSITPAQDDDLVAEFVK